MNVKAEACRLASAVGAGAVAGGLITLDLLGLSAPVASTVGGVIASAVMMSPRVRAFWYGAVARQNS